MKLIYLIHDNYIRMPVQSSTKSVVQETGIICVGRRFNLQYLHQWTYKLWKKKLRRLWRYVAYYVYRIWRLSPYYVCRIWCLLPYHVCRIWRLLHYYVFHIWHVSHYEFCRILGFLVCRLWRLSQCRIFSPLSIEVNYASDT